MTRQETAIQENGLEALRDAHENHLNSINGWHEAYNVLRETPMMHPLYGDARRHYDSAARECANSRALVFLQELKLRRPK